MNFEYGNVNDMVNFDDAPLLWKILKWEDKVKQLLSQLGINYIAMPLCGMAVCYGVDGNKVYISLRTWQYYGNKRHDLSISRTEFTNFLQNLVKKCKIIAKVLPQPIAEEIIDQCSATAELVEFIDSNNASK